MIAISGDILILDAITCGDGVALIVRALESDRITWGFACRETRAAWEYVLLSVTGSPRAIVSDHQKGLRGAVRARFPGVAHQRCLAHVIQQSLLWITQQPKTDAGRLLRLIARDLGTVLTAQDAAVWVTQLEEWMRTYRTFLAERSVSPLGHSWYTHRYLRKAVTLLRGSVPEVFTFTRIPGVPRTSKHVEGGINARLKELLRRHRGLSSSQQQALVAFALSGWNAGRKTTRNDT
jgi:hypothetical protein